MTESPDSGGFRSLWPTVLLERELPGHEAANLALLALIEELERDNADLTTDYLGGNPSAAKLLFARGRPGLADRQA